VAPKSRAELQQALGLSDRKHFGTTYLKPSMEACLIERNSPDKPHSRFQKCRLTAMGRRVLEQAKDRLM
jgi:ATP-dependent DNA helicase RecG